MRDLHYKHQKPAVDLNFTGNRKKRNTATETAALHLSLLKEKMVDISLLRIHRLSAPFPPIKSSLAATFLKHFNVTTLKREESASYL